MDRRDVEATNEGARHGAARSPSRERSERARRASITGRDTRGGLIIWRLLWRGGYHAYKTRLNFQGIGLFLDK